MSKKEIAKERLKLIKAGQVASGDVAQDMRMMHDFYGVHEALENLDRSKLKDFLEFRVNFLKEELNETDIASKASPIDSEEVVDGLIDLVVVAVGTLDLFGVDFKEAWEKVLLANMNKEVGVKESRPNPYGLPDLIKPEGWTAPSHEGNHGILPECK